MNVRLWLVSLLSFALFAACASEGTEPRVLQLPSTSPSDRVADEGSDGGPGDDSARDDNGKKDENDEKDQGTNGGTAGGDESSDRGGEGGSTETDGGSEGGSNGGGSNGRSSDGALYPAPGEYSYSQSGYREFCSGTCDREQLPERQLIRTSVRSRSESGAVVVNEESSDEGSVRMTTRYQDRAALVLEVYTRLEYRGFEFERSYRPDPPVLQLISDLAVGEHWQGAWRGDVSGDYEAAVVARETVAAAGNDISTLKVFTVTNFRGELRGRSDITAWVDPVTLAVVKTKGLVDLDSDFGSYRTKFSSLLVSAPGYR